jgi:transmembrane sensor
VFEAISPHDVDARLAWLNARLEFSNTPLAEAVALMNQHNRVQFVIADPTLREVRVSGFIRADNAEAFAGFLEAGFQIRAERRGANQIVLQRQP